MPDNISESINSYITLVDEKGYIANNSRKIVEQNFKVASLESFGCDKLTLGIEAAAQIIEYLKTHQRSALRTIPTLKTYSTQPFMSLDQQTSRNLEIFSSGRENSQESSLYSILDKTQTPMGGRLLRKWLGQPLLELDLLEERQKAVEWFIEDPIRRGHIAKILTSISDIERLTTKVKMGTAGPRD